MYVYICAYTPTHTRARARTHTHTHTHKEIVDPDPENRPWVEWIPANLEEGVLTTSHEIDGARIQEAGERLKYAFTRKRALFRQSVTLLYYYYLLLRRRPWSLYSIIEYE